MRLTPLVAVAFTLAGGKAALLAILGLAAVLVPALGQATPGGVIQIDVQPDFPAADATTCIFASVGDAISEGAPGVPDDRGHACAGPGTAAQTIFLQAPRARGAIFLATVDEELRVRYVVPAGSAAEVWAGKENGVLKVGARGPVEPWQDISEPVWGGLQGLGYLGAVILLAAQARMRWFATAWAGTALTSSFVVGGSGNMSNVSIIAIALLGLVGLGVALVTRFSDRAASASAAANEDSKPPEATFPQLDAIGLREDLR